MTEKIGFIIQARTGSKRLPDKVLLPFYQNKSILEIIVEKIQFFFPQYKLLIATSIEPNDDKIIKLAHKLKINYYRGSENNVLSRFIDASEQYNLNTIIRVCADNPFLDVDLLKKMLCINKKSEKEYDYISYKGIDGTPVIKSHYGFFCEIVKLEALQAIIQRTSDNLYLEHVTNYIYENKTFNIKLVELPSYMKDKLYIRFTVDDKLDYDNMKILYEKYVKFNFSISKLIDYLDERPDIIKDMKLNIKKYSK